MKAHRNGCPIVYLHGSSGSCWLQAPFLAFGLAVEDLTGTTAPPADDPGWASVTTSGRSAVYLGDSWVLVGKPCWAGALVFEGGTFDSIPGQQWTIANPPNWGGQQLSRRKRSSHLSDQR